MTKTLSRRKFWQYASAAAVGGAIVLGLRDLTERYGWIPGLTKTVTQTATHTVTERKTETQPVTQTVSQTVTERATTTQTVTERTTITQPTTQTVTQRTTETATKTVSEVSTVTQTATQTVTSTQTVTRTLTQQRLTIPPGPISYKIELNRERCNGCGYCVRADIFHFEPGDQGKPKVKGGTISNGKSIGYFTDEKLYYALGVANTCRMRVVTVTEL